MKKIRFLFLLLFIPLVSFTIHKYYISLCEIEYIEDQKSLQIKLALFIDDIELTLNKNHHTELYLATKTEAENVDELYEEYLIRHFKLKVNTSDVAFTYIGKEYDDDIVRFYLEVTDIETLKSLEIQNSCLLRDFQDQQNIIKIKVNKLHKTFYFDNKNDKDLLKF